MEVCNKQQHFINMLDTIIENIYRKPYNQLTHKILYKCGGIQLHIIKQHLQE